MTNNKYESLAEYEEYQAELNKGAMQELAETKRKLEIAVKGLNDLKKHLEIIGIACYTPTYAMIVKCLKDLERVKE